MIGHGIGKLFDHRGVASRIGRIGIDGLAFTKGNRIRYAIDCHALIIVARIARLTKLKIGVHHAQGNGIMVRLVSVSRVLKSSPLYHFHAFG